MNERALPPGVGAGATGIEPAQEGRQTEPDLIDPTPCLRVDPERLKEAITFAFAAGGAGRAFDELFGNAQMPDSGWAGDCYADELFIDDLLSVCLKLRIANRERRVQRGYLKRLLTAPPRDVGIVRFRQRIIQELTETQSLRAAAERSWTNIQDLRTLFESVDAGKRLDAVQRRLDILRAVRDSIEQLERDFAASRSGLARLSAFAESVKTSAGYRKLCSLLDYEENLATVGLEVRVGYDGQLRGFEILHDRQNRLNPFYVSPIGRWLNRLRLWARGYRVREAELMGRLVDGVFDEVQDATAWLLQLGCDLEFYLTACSFRDFASTKGLEVSLPELVTPPGDLELVDLFNPFLLLEDRAPRPCRLKPEPSALVIITGPNSGGKTRLLQAIGLTQLLGQCGFLVPARRARLALRSGLFVSLGREATAEEREGRLGVELSRIRRLFERLSCDSLVILDELCSGTNPSEGEEIFELVVSLLSEVDPQAYITTHFLEFAARLERERPVRSMSFLRVELDAADNPTYGFVPGVARTSLARKTAERLGVTREALVGLVERAKREQGERG